VLDQFIRPGSFTEREPRSDDRANPSLQEQIEKRVQIFPEPAGLLFPQSSDVVPIAPAPVGEQFQDAQEKETGGAPEFAPGHGR